MDFEALLAEHKGEDTAGSAASTTAALKGLDGELSTPRDGGPDSGFRTGFRGGFRGGSWRGVRGGRGRGRGGGRWENRSRGGVVELGEGAFRVERPWGQYLKWNGNDWKGSSEGNILVQFEAKGEDNIVVGLSPEPKVSSPMYEIVIGGWKDTKSVIRREAQGMERAISAQARLCSDAEFHNYWAALHNGVVSVGIGSEPGKGLIIAWRDPEPVPALFVSFTSWDHSVTFRNVRVTSCDDGMEMDDVEMSDFVPGYMAKLEAERNKLKQRADRFDTAFQEPSAKAMASAVLDDAERERMKHDMQRPGGTGFITGFDPTTEEEKKKAEERAKRFGLNKPTDGGEQAVEDDEDMMSRDKREARAKRFQIPVLEDARVGQGLIRDLQSPSVPRRDPTPEESIRDEAIHIYGNFDQVYTHDILEWFGFYGASHVEWLHDCGANVVFSDVMTAKRALLGIAKEIPPIEGFETQVQDLKDKGFMYGVFPLKAGPNEFRFFLLRKAAAGDVKSTDPAYRTNKGYSRSRFRPRRGGRGPVPESSRQSTIVGTRRRRDSDADVVASESEVTAQANEEDRAPSKRTRRIEMEENAEDEDDE